ncbi:hypothetical protein [Streptomyces sp. x-80]|uniref:hypothetical protein n=1 Tax=Streptomyces sp. x-80 TaxID=2789282 RepID=UPI00397F08AD
MTRAAVVDRTEQGLLTTAELELEQNRSIELTTPRCAAPLAPNTAAARVRIAPSGAKEEAFGHLLTRLDETRQFTETAEAEETEELLETVQGAAAAPGPQERSSP